MSIQLGGPPRRILDSPNPTGYPTSGTWFKGDQVQDNNGVIWLCTVSGTPGSWIDVSSSGKELAYAEVVTPQNITSGGTMVDITGLAIAYTARGRPIMVHGYLPNLQNQIATGAHSNIQITDPSNVVKVIVRHYLAAVAFSGEHVDVWWRHENPTPGTQYNWKMRINGGTNYTVQSDPAFPSFLRAIEV